MSENKLTFVGLDEFKQALMAIPDELTDEGGQIVKDYASEALDAIQSRYPERTGNLRNGLRMQVTDSGRNGVSVRVVNVARHSHLFEYGTQARHTDIGANRGAMPAGEVFVPIAARMRRNMYQELIDLLKGKGFAVTGGETL